MSRPGLLFGLLGLLGLGIVLNGLWIPAKAALAQILLDRSWGATLQTGSPQKPWPWADHHAVAQIEAPRQGVRQIVLSGDTGRSLAFAPGFNEASGKNGSATVISAHRDTHFRFLEDVEVGDPLHLTTPEVQRSFEVVGTMIANADEQRLDPSGFPIGLILVTCYPFDALDAGGPLRYVVFAVPSTKQGHSISSIELGLD